MEKHLIIYHAISKGVACDDGFGAYWVAHNALMRANEEAIITPHEGIYGKIPNYDLIDKDTHVHILDFSYPVDILNVIGSRAKSVTLLDHHKSAMERWQVERDMYMYKDRDYIHFNMHMSGVVLAWIFYTHPSTQIPALVAHIQDNDLWKFSLRNTKTFIEALRSFPQDLMTWDSIHKSVSGPEGYLDFVKQGEVINRYYQLKLKEIISYTKEPCTILDHQGLCCNAPKMFASDIGHILAKESGTFGATWFKKSDGSVEWSLRSDSSFDVSAIAKEFGGGGHAKAAGFSIGGDIGQEL